jgi:pyruvate formate lyase activating enzyme
MDERKHKDLTGVSNKKILHSLDYLDANIKKGSQIRIRFVVIPTISTSKSLIEKLGKRVSEIKNLEKLELLPYVTIGKDKWIKLYKVYHLDGVREANENDIKQAKTTLEKFGISF